MNMPIHRGHAPYADNVALSDKEWVFEVKSGSKKLHRTTSDGKLYVYDLIDSIGLLVDNCTHEFYMTPDSREWTFTKNGGGHASIR